MSARCVVDSELELELRLGGARRVEIAQSRFVPDKSGLSDHLYCTSLPNNVT
jgi:hypothetical protein